MRVLVTGGAGFIGSHLVERLLGRGHLVRVIDDMSAGTNAGLLADLGVEVMRADVADARAAAAATRGCDAVAHLAAVASVVASVERPLETLRSNLVGTVTVLHAAAAAGVERVVFASSAAVYGSNQDLPLAEDAREMPLTPYAADKLAGEHYLSHFHRSGAFSGHAFRFFNVYGPRQDPSSPYSGVISVFLDRATRGLPLVVHGDGEQTRDFVYVGDVVELLARALEGDVKTTSDATDSTVAASEALPVTNLGTGRAVSVGDLAVAAGEATGRPAVIEFAEARPGDVRHSSADVTLLRRRFGAVPVTSLADGLKETAASLSERR